MSIDITVTDLFCGAGGSSIGAEAAGARLRMAANHWPLAIQTHNTNFPNADHDCADVSQVNPRRYPRTDILIASPECTNHSSAKTRKVESTIWDPEAGADAERSRATMWDVPRFAEHHRYEIVIVENVLEARRWAPYDAWLQSMNALGYDHRALYLNSMIAHPTPQSRDRMYVVFWRRGNRPPELEVHPRAWCDEHGDVAGVQSWKNPVRPFGKYRTQYVYRCPTCARVALPYAWPAAAAIDWSLPAPRIGDRDRPLADATMRRIRAGLDRYGSSAIVQAAGHTFERPGYYRTWPTWEPLGTQTTTAQHALVMETAYSGRGGDESRRTRPTSEPLGALTAQQTQALVVTMRGTEDAALDGSARRADWPLGPQTTQRHDALVLPMREHGTALPADGAPIGTQVATSSTHALVVPLRTHGTAEPAEVSPVPTVVAGNAGHALLIRNYGDQGGGAEMSRPVSAPTGTVTAVDHHSLLVPYHGTGVAQRVAEPHRAIDARDRFGLMEPAIDVEDCGFRMLEPHEIGRAMAFSDDYVVHGNKRERVRQYGNAVTPPVMALILERAIASLRGAA